MKRLLVAGLVLISGQVVAEQKAWCDVDWSQSSPIHNFPEWACEASRKAALYKEYSIQTGVNPFFLAGDYDGDRKTDVAVWIINVQSKKQGIAILLQGKDKPIIVGAGTPFDKSGDDYQVFYGKQLAIWLKARLEQKGYSVEEIINEDWGRCLMCARDPFMLWVGVGSVTDYDTAKEGDPPPPKEDVVWHCFTTAEVFFWKRLFRKIDTTAAVAKLNEDLGAILGSEQEITIVENA